MLRDFDTELEEMHRDLLENMRNERSITDADLIAMEQHALHIDPDTCPTGNGQRWCPRCGFGCCTVAKDTQDRTRLVCSGGCDMHGHHADKPVTVRPTPEHRDVDDPTTDALGQIDPSDREAFTAFQVGRLTRPLKVDDCGRVFAPFYVCGAEAESLGDLIAEFNAAVAAGKGRAAYKS